jgi:GxxExxY protein
MDENTIAEIIVDKCFKIHNKIGPGLLESIYEDILFYELANSSLKCEKQVPIKVEYDGRDFGIGYRADIVVEKSVIVELKSVETIVPVHKKQLLTYLKLTGCKLGLLINFNEALIKNGITRIVNNL